MIIANAILSYLVAVIAILLMATFRFSTPKMSAAQIFGVLLVLLLFLGLMYTQTLLLIE